MPTELSGVPVIQTKLHSPRLPADLVEREIISIPTSEELPPLILLCASAGQGKTIAIIEWLKRSDLPHCWYGVDDADSDLRVFITHLLHGITGATGHECGETAKLLQLDHFPEAAILAGALSNDLDAISPPLVIVLDDFHEIGGKEVPAFLDRLLDYLPSGFSFAIATRSAPELALNKLRGRNQLIQLGDSSLQFNQKESEHFFLKALDQRLDQKTLNSLLKTTSGWAVGMRLAAIALKGEDEIHSAVQKMDGGAKPLLNYLHDEVLSRFSEFMTDCLLKLSCVESFNLSLAEAVVSSDEQWQPCGPELKECLQEGALPCTSKGGTLDWYSFHDVFRELLKQQAATSFTAKEWTDTCLRAAQWHEDQGNLEEALELTLQSGSTAEGGEMILRQRNTLTQNEHWVRLAKLLQRLPHKLVDQDPELLILKSWSIENRDQVEGDKGLLAKAENLLSHSGHWQEKQARLEGEIMAIRSSILYSKARGAAAVSMARQALKNLPDTSVSERAFTRILLATSLQMTGDLTVAYDMIHEELGHLPEKGTTRHGRLLITLCFLHWLSGEMPELQDAASAAINVGRSNKLQQTENYGRYFLGLVQYQTNQLENASQTIEPIFSDDHVTSIPIYLLAMPLRFALLRASEKNEEASEFASAISRFVLRGGITAHFEAAQSLKAEIALASDQVTTVTRWAKNLESTHRKTPYGSVMPELVASRVLIAEGSPNSLEDAKVRLEQIASFLDSTHNVRFLIDLHLTRTLWAEAMNDEVTAMDSLSNAIRLAQPGAMIRTFVDHGPVIQKRLSQVKTDEAGARYLGTILEAFRQGTKTPKITWSPGPAVFQTPEGELLESLSKREHEVLQHLALRQSNKEIAGTLFISPGTVKRHTSSIYQKLQVHGRKEAVLKAKGLGILH